MFQFNSYRQYLREILVLLDKDRGKIPWLLLLFIGSSLLEVIGLSLIGYYVTLVVNPEIVALEFVDQYLERLGFNINGSRKLIVIGAMLIIVFASKSAVGLFTHWANMRIVLSCSTNRIPAPYETTNQTASSEAT